ncbi:flagellar protein FlaG [Pseudomonas sp. S37]|uniref:flagellar protein FlaG n=1 Tax=Pseudomonas sp. S37 TaxID=2767449 RepID=UPI001911E312|nr:flagellar protein FlaG [Pseudomonas sp. S37]MBK4994442.1 flagellar protein FlaG [Pseudomonas sp. S37]
MDMSVKLNLSYAAARPAEPAGDKPFARPTDASSASSDTLEPKAINAAEHSNDVEKVKSAVSEIEKFLSSSRRNLEFSTDEESGKIVVRVIASETGELIRQLPSEEALRIAHSLSDVNSLLFDAKV